MEMAEKDDCMEITGGVK